jgi:hypothetical protein
MSSCLTALGLYPPWVYPVSQFFQEAWVLVLAAMIQAVIVIPMIGLWNVSMSPANSFLTMLAVFIVNGMAGNAIVLFVCMLASAQDLAFLFASGFVTIGLAASGGKRLYFSCILVLLLGV